MEKCADCKKRDAEIDQLCKECYAEWEEDGVLE